MFVIRFDDLEKYGGPHTDVLHPKSFEKQFLRTF